MQRGNGQHSGMRNSHYRVAGRVLRLVLGEVEGGAARRKKPSATLQVAEKLVPDLTFERLRPDRQVLHFCHSKLPVTALAQRGQRGICIFRHGVQPLPR